MPRLYSLLLLMSSAVFLFSTPAGAEEAQAGVKSTALRGPLHLLQGKGGNVVASVGIDGILLPSLTKVLLLAFLLLFRHAMHAPNVSDAWFRLTCPLQQTLISSTPYDRDDLG